MKHSQCAWAAWPRLLLGLALAGLLLTGCQPTAQPTLPPATQVNAPHPVTAELPVDKPAVPPTAQPTVAPPTAAPPTALAPTDAPTQAPTQQPVAANAERKPVQVTVLHVNDVMGEIDPCG